MKTLAILTAVYNRRELIQRLYKSLLSQTSCDFSWYIADDGSTDGLENEISGFKNGLFDVFYLKKENGGKHTALNEGLKEISEELTMIVDSDDVLTSGAVATLTADWDRYKDDSRINGMSYYKGDIATGKVLWDRYPGDCECVDSFINMRINKGVQGDKAEVWRTSVLRSFPFPVFEGERFLSEAIVWNRMSAAGYLMAFIPKTVYLCEYLDGGLSSNGRLLMLKNPLGAIEHALSHTVPAVNLKNRLKYSLLLAALAVYSGKTGYALKKLNLKYKFICCLMLPAGFVISVYWKRKYAERV